MRRCWHALALVFLALAVPAAAGGERPHRSGITEWSSDVPEVRARPRPLEAVALPLWVEEALAEGEGKPYAEASFEILPGRRQIDTHRLVLRTGDEERPFDVRVEYDPGSSSVEHVVLWVLSGSELRRFGREFLFDRSVARDSTRFNARFLGGRFRLPPHSVAALEYSLQRPLLFEDWWLAGDDGPPRRMRLALTPPGGALPESHHGVRSGPDPERAGPEWRWDASHLFSGPAPPFGAAVEHDWLALRLPPAGPEPQWRDLGARLARAFEAPAGEQGALRRTVDSLCAGAVAENARIRRLAEFVQAIPYAEIRLDVASGGGLVPRPPARVLADRLGDCKDKANLLCALLRTAGVRAWPVLVGVESMDTRLPPWPSTRVFDHAICAIATRDSARMHFTDPALGAFELFDPTDGATAYGGIREDLGGKPGLVLADSLSSLVVVPVLPGGHDRVWRELEAEVDGLGASRVRLEARYSGAALLRADAPDSLQPPGAWRRTVEREFLRWDPRVRNLGGGPLADSAGSRRAAWTFEYAAPGPGSALLRWPLAAWPADEMREAFPESLASHLRTRGMEREATLRLRLAPGVTVDSLPESSRFSNELGEAASEVRRTADGVEWSWRFRLRGGVALAAGETGSFERLARAAREPLLASLVLRLPGEHALQKPPAPRARPGLRR